MPNVTPRRSRQLRNIPLIIQFTTVVLCIMWPTVVDAEVKNPLSTLTTIQAVHTLAPDVAARGYPVHIKGVVTYFDPYLNDIIRPIVFVTDPTGTIYVAVPGHTTSLPLKAGSLVDVHGVSGHGDFAPTISNADLRITGEGPLPAHPPRESLTHLLTGSEDAKWIEMEGVVEAVETSGKNLTLKLAVRDGGIAATTIKRAGVDYASLIDARVRIHGIGGSLFNKHSQIIGANLFFPGLETVSIVEKAPQQPFKLPVSAISSLMTYFPGQIFFHRTHVRGTVTLFWPGRLLCVRDSSASVCAGTEQTTPLQAGQQVDLLGFPQLGSVTPTLRNAVYQASSAAGIGLSSSPIDALQALSGNRDSQLVQMEGTLIAHDRAARDTTIVLSSANRNFTAILPQSVDGQRIAALPESSKVRLTGICLDQANTGVFTHHDGYAVVEQFQILLRSADDVIVLQKPSWWNTKHTLWVLACALGVTLGILAWVIYLQRRVRKQAALLHHQATHDVLTGVWNRRALLDLLRCEFEKALRAGHCIVILMLDADRFKSINDQHGHLAGDAVLRELASRIQQVIRSNDLVGRYGGEEFLIAIVGCAERDAENWAERVRAVVAHSPMMAEGSLLAVTVSIGAAVLDPKRGTPRDALAAADSAMYEAKQAGRNRVAVGQVRPSIPATGRHVILSPMPSQSRLVVQT